MPLYDVDFIHSTSTNDPSGEFSGTTLPPLLQELLPTADDHPVLGLAAQLLARLYTARDKNEDPVWGFGSPAGGRLGATLSAADGSFSIEYDDAAFRRDGKEQRPDGLLMVLAPDQSLDRTRTGWRAGRDHQVARRPARPGRRGVSLPRGGCGHDSTEHAPVHCPAVSSGRSLVASIRPSVFRVTSRTPDSRSGSRTS